MADAPHPAAGGPPPNNPPAAAAAVAGVAAAAVAAADGANADATAPAQTQLEQISDVFWLLEKPGNDLNPGAAAPNWEPLEEQALVGNVCLEVAESAGALRGPPTIRSAAGLAFWTRVAERGNRVLPSRTAVALHDRYHELNLANASGDPRNPLVAMLRAVEAAAAAGGTLDGGLVSRGSGFVGGGGGGGGGGGASGSGAGGGGDAEAALSRALEACTLAKNSVLAPLAARQIDPSTGLGHALGCVGDQRGSCRANTLVPLAEVAAVDAGTTLRRAIEFSEASAGPSVAAGGAGEAPDQGGGAETESDSGGDDEGESDGVGGKSPGGSSGDDGEGWNDGDDSDESGSWSDGETTTTTSEGG